MGNGDLYVMDNIRYYIVKYLLLDLVVILFCNVLILIGICWFIDKGLLIIFIDVVLDLELVIF